MCVQRLYLAKWDPRDYPEPEAGQEQRIRDWIRAKYIEKRWCVFLRVFGGKEVLGGRSCEGRSA